MIKNEIVSLKEEMLKEIHEVENKLNLQIMLKTKQLIENNNKFVEDFNIMLEKNKSLINLITSLNINFDKINDFDNFRKKADSMMITHEIRINNSIKEIQDIKFKIGKDSSDTLYIPGFIGPSCKYKSFSNFISSNINEIDRIKTENESNRKENKEIKKKFEDIIKTVLNLVDGSNSKCIDYTNKKIKKLEENVIKRIEDYNDKIINFKSMLMSQDKIKEIHDNLYKKFHNNHYNKNEIDEIVEKMANDFRINLNNFKINYVEHIKNSIEISMDKLYIDIKGNSKSIKEIKEKILRISQIQSQLIKNNLSMKNVLINNKNSNINNYSNSNINLNEEEKFQRFKNFISHENKIIEDSVENIKGTKNDLYKTPEHTFYEKTNKYNIDNYLNKKNDKNKGLLNISFSKNDKQNQTNFYNNEENKTSISNFKILVDSIKNRYNLTTNKENVPKKFPFSSKAINKSLNLKKKIIEIKDEKQTFIIKKENINEDKGKNILNDKENNNSKIISFERNNTLVKIIGDHFSNEKPNNKIRRKKRGFSLHKFTSIGLDEKGNNFLINKDTNKNIKYNIKKPKTPIVKNIFHQKYKFNLSNNKIKDSISIEYPIKISSSFGRTMYTFYDKKEEGMNNLIDKEIKRKLKENKKNENSINLELSPVSKIKVYNNF